METKDTDRKALWDTLNRLGEQLCQLSPTEDSAAYLAVRNEIWLTAYSYFQKQVDPSTSKDKSYDEKKDGVISFADANDILNCLIADEMVSHYNAEKGSLASFLTYRFKNRIRDRRKQIYSERQKQESLSLPEDSEDEVFERPVPDEQAEIERTVAAREELVWVSQETTAEILNFTQRRGGKQGNETNRNYFRILFTADMINRLQTAADSIKWRHETDMLEAMKLPYVDFCMVLPCDTFQKITYGMLKQYAQVVDGAKDVPIPLPIPDNVSISYLARVENKVIGKSAFSHHRKDYNDLIQTLMGGNK